MVDGMPNFGELCDMVLETLRGSEAELGLPAESVREGVLGKLPDWPAPYIAVFCDPIDALQGASGASVYNTAGVTLLICARHEERQALALREAVAIAARAYRVINNLPLIQMNPRSLERFSSLDSRAVVTINGTHPFTLLD